MEKIKNSAGTAENIANRLSDTATGAFRELDSSVESIGISFGNTLLPAISSTTRGIAGFASGISALAERFPVITKYIGMAITSLVVLKIATISYGYALTFVKGPFLWMQGALLTMRARMLLMGLTMPVVTTAIRTMSVALISSPITWIVAGIAGAAYLLIKNWAPVGEFFKNLFSGIVGWAEMAFNWISKILTPLKPIVSAVGNFAGKAWNFVAGNDQAKNPSSGAVGNVVSNLESSKSDTHKIPSFEMPNIPSSPSGIGAQQISISAPITINTSGNMDEKKIADQVRIAIDETFRKLSARKLALNYDQ